MKNDFAAPRPDRPPVVGVVCEYDPFHAGHARQFALIRERLPGAAIVCAMSGPFTQRGAAALFSPGFRAEQALRAGADAVFELPCLFAVREAEHFALGGVSLLARLGGVTHLSFGCEAEDIAPLEQAAALIEREPTRWRAAVRQAQRGGRSYAAAQGTALSRFFPEVPADTFSSPNNALALCYLRALLRLRAPLAPLPVRRTGAYRAQTLDVSSPSATAVRIAILCGDRQSAEAACGYELPLGPVCPPDALDVALLYRLRGMSAAALAALPDCTEGLENRLLSCAREATGRDTLLNMLKTKRYTYARLSRLCCHALLDMPQALLDAYAAPPYARLLGFRRASEGLLSRLSQGQVPIVSKAADGPTDDPCYQLDERAYDLWALGAGMPAGWMRRMQVVAVE